MARAAAHGSRKPAVRISGQMRQTTTAVVRHDEGKTTSFGAAAGLFAILAAKGWLRSNCVASTRQ
jgi:hypothetical protein